MRLTELHREDFYHNGATIVDAAIPAERVAIYDNAISEIYSGWQARTDGIVGYCEHPGLFDLYQEPALEAIAKHLLGCERVVLASAAILHTRPQPGATFKLGREHVDIMYSRADWDAWPRNVMCVLIAMIGDLPKGRANTYVRLGSHLMLADEIARRGEAPVRAKPTNIDDLPDLDWPPATPLVARAGQVVGTTTNLVHSGTPNLDSENRRMVFVSFTPLGALRYAVANHDQRELRTRWRDRLRASFREDRKHLLDDNED